MMTNKAQKLWEDRIEKFDKFFQRTLEQGRKVCRRYADDREDASAVEAGIRRANFFYSNVNTIKESLYNSLPKPDVSRLHKGATNDDVARVAAEICERGLSYEVHCAKSFDEAVKAAILDRLVPGVGQLWVRFVPGNGEGEMESIAVDVVYWEDFLYQPVRNWQAVTWLGRRIEMTKEQITSIYGADAMKMVQQVADTNDTLTPKELRTNKYDVYEMWDRKSRKVCHIAKGAEKPLLELDDPYKLSNFFPCPKPLLANPPTNKFLPITDFHVAEDQYIVLDTLTARINLIIQAVRVAGVYDSATPEIGRMLQGAENRLIPVDNWAMFAEKGGAKGVIDWFPVDVVVQVLQQLYMAMDATKQLLYEITGMSDILRGASNPYETKGAQEIKAQFASVRMNAYQRDVAFFVRDTLRIISELMVQLYSDAKLQQIVGPLPEPDMQYVEAAVQVLRDDLMTKYKVDIEADSLTQADWALEKEQRLEFLNVVSTFLQSAVPAVESVPELGMLLLQMIKFGIAGFKGSTEMEGWIDQQLDQLLQKAQNPEPAPPSPEEQKMQMEMQKMQGEMQIEQQKAELEAQSKQMDLQIKQQEAAAKLEMMREEHQLKMQIMQQEAMLKLELEREKANQQVILGAQKVEAEGVMNEQRLVQNEEAFEQKQRQSKESSDDR